MTATKTECSYALCDSTATRLDDDGAPCCDSCYRSAIDAGLRIYGARANGARAVEVEVPENVKVLVTSGDGERNETALAVARDVYKAGWERAGLRVELDNAKRCHKQLLERIRELEEQLAEAEVRERAATDGKRRFFGPVLMVPKHEGDWSGPVLLQDPDKRERGRSLVFASVAEVRALHPELWVVEVRDGGVLLDAWGETPVVGGSR
jgi:hypothetical protein